jgi:hypothetical protein
MAIKKKDGTPIRGIIARPGPYTYAWGIEHKTAEELKRAIAMTPTIPITLGHPINGVIKRSDFIGRVKPTWNDEEDAVEGEFWPYREHWHKVPKEIRENIVNGEIWKISASFNAEKVNDDIQKDVYMDHVAILQKGDDPVCPLDKCGINVRQESQSATGTKIYYEQTSEIGGEGIMNDTEPKEETQKQEDDQSVQKPDDRDKKIEVLTGQVEELTLMMKDLAATNKELSEQKPEATEEEKEPVTAQTVEVPAPVPETVFPVGSAADESLKHDEDGNIVIIVQPPKSVG